MQSNKPATLCAVPMTLFPTLDSLENVLVMAASKMPVNQWNEMHSILMTYHNTLLKVIKET